jgi:short-subunit dehydrogenase
MSYANGTEQDAGTHGPREHGVTGRGVEWGLVAAALGAGALLVGGLMLRERRRLDVKGKVALITGGSRGLGLVLARKLCRLGANVAICARDAEELAAAQDMILRDTGCDVLAIPCDVTDRGEVDSLVRAVEERLGPVDILVNNAGIITVGPMEAMTEGDYAEAMAVNFWAPYNTVHAVLPSMRERRAGRIVNVASIGGKVSIPHLLPYSASKFALVGFSEGLRAELLKDGVFVTTVCPGMIRTGSPRNALYKGQNEKEYAWFSIGDSLPGVSQSAEACADEIVAAMVRGDAEVVTSLPAKALALVHGIAPGAVSDLSAAAARLLPENGGVGSGERYGYESESELTRSPLSILRRRAEEGNNQLLTEAPVAPIPAA